MFYYQHNNKQNGYTNTDKTDLFKQRGFFFLFYGARANNGVILVTTKKGVEGRTQITYKFNRGCGVVLSSFKSLSYSVITKTAQNRMCGPI